MGEPGWYRSMLSRHQTKIRFLMAGGANTLFGFSIFPILFFALKPFDVHYLLILSLSYLFSVTFAYLTNKYFVFKTQGICLKEIAKFLTYHVACFLVNLIALPLLVEVMHLSPVVAQTGFVVFVVATSYLWHSRVTFSNK